MHINSIFKSNGSHPTILRGQSRLLLVQGATAHLIEMRDPPSPPYAVSLNALKLEIENRYIDEVIQPSDAAKRRVSRDQLSKAEAETFDKYWKWLKPVVQQWRTSLITDRDRRERVIVKRAEVIGTTTDLMGRLLYRYWAGGFEPLAIAPAFHLRGGIGKAQKAGTRRRGRKARAYGHVSTVLMTDCKEGLEKGIRRFIKNEGRPIDEAYELTVRTYFPDPQQREERKLFKPTENQPTASQFDRVLRRLRKEGVIQSHRPRARRGPRVRTGTARDGVLGAGVRFEGDFTKLRVDLVSVFDSSLYLGTPVYYHIPDVYSRVITGFHVTLENGSWAAARLALAHSFTPKVDACREIGIEIKEEEWPCHHVPQVFSADRGEFAGDAADALPDELDVELDLEPPYKPDGKSIVERLNRHIKEGRLKTLPGARLFNARGEIVRAKNPCVTLPALRRALVSIIIQMNYDPVPAEKIPALMIQDGWRKASRLDVWRWSMQRLVGGGRTRDPRSVYFALLKKATATLREDGLYYRGNRYMSAGLRDSGLLDKALRDGAFNIEIRFDDYMAARVWRLDKIKNDWDLLEIVDRDIFGAQASFEESVLLAKQREEIRASTYIANSERKQRFDRIVESEAQYATSNATKTLGVRGGKAKDRLRENRIVEKSIGRVEHTHTVLSSYAAAANHQNDKDTSETEQPATPPQAVSRRSRLLALARNSVLKNTEKEKS